MHFFKKIALSLYCITLVAICQYFFGQNAVFAASSNTENFYFEDFEADYYLEKANDGTSRLRVHEKFTAVFPDYKQNHGIRRIIPFTNQAGNNLTTKSDRRIEVKAWQNGIAVKPAKIEREKGYFAVFLGNEKTYVTGHQNYELEYEFQNVITNQNDFSAVRSWDETRHWQELYWDTNGNDWAQTFGQVTARVHLVGAVKGLVNGQSDCYVGYYGDKGSERCEITPLADGLEFSADDLKARENLTFVIGFQEDSFVVPGKPDDYRLVVALAVVASATTLLTVLSVRVRRKTKAKRKFYKDLFTKPEYTPPAGFSVAEMAKDYIKPSRLGSSRVATLLDLAVRHKVDLVEIPKGEKSAKTKWQIVLKTADFTPEEATLLQILAGKKRDLVVGEKITLKTHTYTSELGQLGKDFDKLAEEGLLKKGLMEGNGNDQKPKEKNPCDALIVLTVLWGIALWVGVCIFAELTLPKYRALMGEEFLGLLAPMAIFGIVFAVMTYNKCNNFAMRTEKGLEYAKYLDGLKMYIELAEKERLEVLQSVEGADVSPSGIVKLYEKLLPYAVLFHQEKSWLKTLGQYYETSEVGAPSWYMGVHTFSSDSFYRAMTAASGGLVSSAAHSGITSSSSSSSGGGGGGFSGGGGGGGGGGGW